MGSTWTQSQRDKTLIEELLEIEENLTQRELDFIESIDDQVIKRGGYLTEKQRKWAEAIAEEKA